MSDHREGVVSCFSACAVGTVFLNDFLYEYRDLKGKKKKELLISLFWISLFWILFNSLVLRDYFERYVFCTYFLFLGFCWRRIGSRKWW